MSFQIQLVKHAGQASANIEAITVYRVMGEQKVTHHKYCKAITSNSSGIKQRPTKWLCLSICINPIHTQVLRTGLMLRCKQASTRGDRVDRVPSPYLTTFSNAI